MKRGREQRDKSDSDAYWLGGITVTFSVLFMLSGGFVSCLFLSWCVVFLIVSQSFFPGGSDWDHQRLAAGVFFLLPVFTQPSGPVIPAGVDTLGQ